MERVTDVIIVELVLNIRGCRGILTRGNWKFQNNLLSMDESSSVYIEISSLGGHGKMRHEWRSLTMSKSLLILLSCIEQSKVRAAI